MAKVTPVALWPSLIRGNRLHILFHIAGVLTEHRILL